MYGPTKFHKVDCLLHLIPSMSGSLQYGVLTIFVLCCNMFLSPYGTRCARDTFHFLSELRGAFVPANDFLCSFDVDSSFMNVLLIETIDTCDVLYHTSDVVPPTWSEQSFRELVSMVTTPSGVEFSVDDVMYRQIDKVGMGSPLGPVLANIFAGFCESHILDVEYPPLYCRFVDDCWTLFC